MVKNTGTNVRRKNHLWYSYSTAKPSIGGKQGPPTVPVFQRYSGPAKTSSRLIKSRGGGNNGVPMTKALIVMRRMYYRPNNVN